MADFIPSTVKKDETLNLLGAIANPPKSEDKYVDKVFNWSEVHLSK